MSDSSWIVLRLYLLMSTLGQGVRSIFCTIYEIVHMLAMYSVESVPPFEVKFRKV